jgi:S1-C subfamily serine protease
MSVRAGLVLAVAALAGCGGGAPPAVQAVRVPNADATAFGIGEGRVMTVAHVLAGGGPVRVGERSARVLQVDRRLDVAVLAIRGEGSGVRGGAAAAGDRVTVHVLRSGRERSLPATVLRTITARVGGETRPALEVAAAVMPGDSGAPVVDGRGRLVGVVFAEASDRDAVAYALDARALGAMLEP